MAEPSRALAVRQTDLQRRSASSNGLQRWADALGLSPLRMGLAGVGLVVAGIVGAGLNPLGLAGVIVCSSLMTAGGGMLFLGIDKARRGAVAPRAPSSSERAVLDERARRVRTLMAAAGGEWTFELLRARLKWTDQALVSALLHMRDEGQIMEDLNLDSGKWVYRLQDADLERPGSSATMTLDDRARRARIDASDP